MNRTNETAAAYIAPINLAGLAAAAAARGSDATYAIGRNGTTNAGRTGAKVHLLMSYTMAGRPVTESCATRNRNGRSAHAPIAGLDTNSITCASCRRWLDRTAAMAKAAAAARLDTSEWSVGALAAGVAASKAAAAQFKAEAEAAGRAIDCTAMSAASMAAYTAARYAYADAAKAREAEAAAPPQAEAAAPAMMFGRDPSLLLPGVYRDTAMAEAARMAQDAAGSPAKAKAAKATPKATAPACRASAAPSVRYVPLNAATRAVLAAVDAGACVYGCATFADADSRCHVCAGLGLGQEPAAIADALTDSGRRR